MGKKYLDTKENSIESAVMQVWQEAAKKLDPVGKADADIDNDGDVDSSDKYLTKRRKAIGKAMKEDFKPHMMYDPKTGKAYKAEKEEDHLRMKKMGYVHEKPKVKEGLEDSPNPANSQHLCAKNVVHEDWGKGETVHGMHAIPDADGNIAWYDVMFEHGIEKGIAINELKIKTSESHHNHDGKKKKNEGAMKRGKDMDTFKPKPKNEQAVPKSGFGLPTPKNVAKRVGMLGKAIKDRSDKAGKVPTSPVAKLSKEEVEFEKHREFKMQSMRDAVKKVWENENL